ncbi:MAG: sigma-70 family RNA polymerase sigma factor [Chloroflexia bacterium]|nr:sigma-70 family RNA polymerase sigma factor [Chloroflexia bacterium]
MADLPDGELIARAQIADLDAFNHLVNRHQNAVYSVALRYMRAPDLADDVTQDTFLRAYRSIDTFKNDNGVGFRSWLVRIASNRSLDVLRSQKRRPADSLDAAMDDEESNWTPEDPSETPLQFTERGDLAQHLEWALGQISPDQRMVVILSDIQGHSYDEIAEITGVAPGTVKSRLHRARARLRDVLQDSGELSSPRERLQRDGERG